MGCYTWTYEKRVTITKKMRVRSLNNLKKKASVYKKALKPVENLVRQGEDTFNIKLNFFNSYLSYLEQEGLFTKDRLVYNMYDKRLNLPYIEGFAFLTKEDVNGFSYLFGLLSSKNFIEVCEFIGRLKFEISEFYTSDNILDDICETLNPKDGRSYSTSLKSSKFILKGFDKEPLINFRVLDYPEDEFYDPKSLFNFVLKKGKEGLARIYIDGDGKNYVENPTLFEESIRKCIFDAYEKHPEMVVHFG